MFIKGFLNVKKGITLFTMVVAIIIMVLGLTGCTISNTSKSASMKGIHPEYFHPEKLIRFHVVANSDSDEDQIIKYAVRDEVLKRIAPRLAESKSLQESRQIIKEMEGQLLHIANTVVQDHDVNHEVVIDHGKHIFPTKTYGSMVLPGGEYEAVKIKIGEARGENWWCVLFPPICFVNVEESTSVSVDGKPGVPLDVAGQDRYDKDLNKDEKKPKVQFYLTRFFR